MLPNSTRTQTDAPRQTVYQTAARSERPGEDGCYPYLLCFSSATIPEKPRLVNGFFQPRKSFPSGRINARRRGKDRRMKFSHLLFVFLLGALGYGGAEVLWRGHTHWTMLLLGGAGFLAVYRISVRAAPPLCHLLSAAALTALEFSCGLLVNRALGWDVWDYSALPGNLLGQICPQYALIWLALSVPCCALARALNRCVFLPLNPPAAPARRALPSPIRRRLPPPGAPAPSRSSRCGSSRGGPRRGRGSAPHPPARRCPPRP